MIYYYYCNCSNPTVKNNIISSYELSHYEMVIFKCTLVQMCFFPIDYGRILSVIVSVCNDKGNVFPLLFVQ